MGLREGFRRETLGPVETLMGESGGDCKGREEKEPPRSEVLQGVGRILLEERGALGGNRRPVERVGWKLAVWV